MSHREDQTREPDLELAGLSLWALSRAFPDSEDLWDGDWIDIVAAVDAPGARVEIRGPYLQRGELAAFQEGLAALYTKLDGSAELECIEPALKIRVNCLSLGHVEVAVEITPDHLNQSHRFSFAVDQSYLAAALSGCRRILERFAG